MKRLRIAAAAAAVTAFAVLTACRPAGQDAGPQQTVSAPQPPAATTASPVPQSPSRPPAARRQAGASALRQVHDPGEVTGGLTGPCRYRDSGQLPDPSCTPGAVDPAVIQADIAETICRHGYTRTVRPPEADTERFKFDEAYPAYGVADGTRTELDHLVPLELGGSNDAANLWPERPPTPNPKDDVEGALHDAVCSGRVSLAAAQRAIAANWSTAEARLGLG